MIRIMYAACVVALLASCGSVKDFGREDLKRPEIPLEVRPVLTKDNVKPQYKHLFDNDESGLQAMRAAYRKGMALDAGTYTYYFEACDYYRAQYVELQLDYYESLTTDIHFKKGKSWESSDFRIICADSLGFTSFMGKDIFLLDSTHWTTSLGEEYYYSYVQYATQHELFGHCIMGLDHEHHNRKGRAIDWNREVLDASFKKRFGWDSDRVTQWINRFETGYVSTDFDPKSFMMYVYDCSFTNDGYGCGHFNYIMSMKDIETAWRLHGNGYLKP